MKILAGIVTYNPEIVRLKENIAAISSQVDKVIIVDNGSKNLKEIEGLSNEYACKLIALKENKGIAHALNKILKYAFNHQFHWFLTLDQDSIVGEYIIRDYRIALSQKSGIGVLTCVINNANIENEKCEGIKSKEFISEVDECISSGCLCNTEILNEIGGFDERLFIDCVDNDLCINLIKHGYIIARVNTRVNLFHQMGNARYVKVLKRNYVTYNEPPFRHYYITRNWILLSKKYSHNYYGRIFRIWLKALLLEDNKYKMTVATFWGFYDGLLSKTGKLSRRL